MVVVVHALIAISLFVVAGPLAFCLSANQSLSATQPFTSAAQQTPQSETPQPKSDADSFFSGNVVETASDHIVVSRTILGKAPEKRRFMVNGSTKVEGHLRNKARVTVRFDPTPEGDVALSVLVRENASEKPENKKK
jgi:hypothetical protein